MKKSIYKIVKMDCPSEEQLIRMTLNDIKQIQHLNFDIPNRKLEVFHLSDVEPITEKINSLNFDSSLLETKTTSEHISQSDDSEQRKLLWTCWRIVLFIRLLYLLLVVQLPAKMVLQK